MSLISVFASASTGTGTVTSTIEDERRARFQKVDENLRAISAIPIERFADTSSFNTDGLFDFPEAPERSRHYAGSLKPIRTLADLGVGSSVKNARAAVGAATPLPEPANVFSGTNGLEGSAGTNMQFVAQLHQTCISTFGNADGLEFEFSEETGKPDSKKCILTISRPNGQTRSYASEPTFSRKSDAKARAAAMAVKLGAVDFILHGYKDASKKQIKLVPLESLSTRKKLKLKEEEEEEAVKVVEEEKLDSKEPTPEAAVEEDEASKEISQCCKEWRAGLVKPRWVFFKENKNILTHGCALAIELTLHVRKLYSVSPTFESKEAAKKACSTEAIATGVIDYIKHGNGQTKPAEISPAHALFEEMQSDPKLEQGGQKSIALQDFFESLPQPFPDLVEPDFERQSPPGVLNSTMQMAKGARLKMDWYFYGEKKQNGAIIRLHRLEETRTYMVDPMFARRGDAKSAVALQAMSEGACAYMKQLGSSVESKITSEMKRFASGTILPILGSEYGKIRKGVHPQFMYNIENDAFGATLTLWLNDNEHRSWSILPEYRTKQDAKLAIAHAHGREAISYLRFRGEEPPQGYDPLKAKTDQKAAATRVRQDSKIASGKERSSQELRVKREEKGDNRRERQRTPTGPRSDRVARRDRPRSSYPGNINVDQSRLAAAASVVIDRVTGGASSSNTPPRPPHLARSASSTPSQIVYSPAVPPYHPQAPVADSTSIYGTPQPPYQPYSPPYPPMSSYIHPHPHPHVSPPPPPTYYQAYTGPVYPYAYPPPPPQPQTEPQTYPFPSADGTVASVYGVPSQPIYHQSYYPDLHQPQAQYQHPVVVTYSNSAHPPPHPPPQPPQEYWSQPLPPSVPPPPLPRSSTSPTPPERSPRRYEKDERKARRVHDSSLPTPPSSTEEGIAGALPSISHSQSVSRAHNTPPVPDVRYAADSETADTDRPSPSASIIASPTRTVSFGAGKRPRASREGTPEDVHVHKKHRSESSLPMVAMRGSGSTETINGSYGANGSATNGSVSSGPGGMLNGEVRAPLAPQSEKCIITSSNFELLLQFCKARELSVPEFGSKMVRDAMGNEAWKVWIMHGKERLEMPATFSSREDGQQRVSRLVLQRLKKQMGIS